MSTHEPARVQSGTPDGGQFATTARSEPGVTLVPGTSVADDSTPEKKARYAGVVGGTQDAYLDLENAADPSQGCGAITVGSPGRGRATGEARVAAVTGDVASQLGVGRVDDEGGGPAIFFDRRTPDAPESDYAYYLAPGDAADPSQGGKWNFHRGDTGVRLPNGDWTQDFTSDLTLDSDPAEVASWIKLQLQGS